MYEVIETVNLSKSFKDFWGRVKAKALDDLNLRVYQGEIFGLLGPNGSGKTTTIKLLLGLLFPTKGAIKVFGKSPRNVENKKRIGFLPEESYLYPYQNAEEALYFYARLFGFSPSMSHSRVDNLLRMVGLSKARKRPLKEYSKGMARRIGIAQALINDPELIFLDEPTSGLDPVGTREIKDLILLLKNHGKTIFLCSHLLADVEDICDRLAILYGGKIRQEGGISELLSKQSVNQLTLDGISEDSLAEITKYLEQKNIKFSVSKAKERLETFFLQVVEEAQNLKIKTSGAEKGEHDQHFFSGSNEELQDTGNDIINKLVASKMEVEPQEKEIEIDIAKEEKQAVEQEVVEDKLSGLVAVKSSPVSPSLPSEPKKASQKEEKKEVNTHNNILNNLLVSNKKEK